MTEAPSRLRVASYNIHECVGRDRRRDPKRVAEVLRDIDADVIGLQEVDARPGPGTESMQMQYLADALGLEAIAGPTITRHDGHYGNALLTRWPLRRVRHVELTVYRREPRGAIDVDVDVDGVLVRVVVTHLGLWPGERRSQVRRLLQILDEGPPRPIVLCGDVNEWLTVGRPLRWLHERLGSIPAIPTFPTRRPVFALDRVWVCPRTALVGLRVPTTVAARLASDHFPIVADIDIAAQAGSTASARDPGLVQPCATPKRR
jgi:endonuclease/exonuclease/phosphatase family metal-dependent hydrolase